MVFQKGSQGGRFMPPPGLLRRVDQRSPVWHINGVKDPAFMLSQAMVQPIQMNQLICRDSRGLLKEMLNGIPGD